MMSDPMFESLISLSNWTITVNSLLSHTHNIVVHRKASHKDRQILRCLHSRRGRGASLILRTSSLADRNLWPDGRTIEADYLV